MLYWGTVKDMAGLVETVIAGNVRQFREGAQWSQADLADRLGALGLAGWTQAGVASIENGSRRPRIDDIAGLCAALGRPLADLLRDAEPWIVAALTDVPHEPDANAVAKAAADRESRDLYALAARHLKSRGNVPIAPEDLATWAQHQYGSDLYVMREAAARHLLDSGYRTDLTRARSTATRELLARLAHDYPQSREMKP